VVTIQLYFAIFKAFVIASFFGELLNLSLSIIEKSIDESLSTEEICSLDLSVDSSSTKITSKAFFVKSISKSVLSKLLRFFSSFLKGITIEICY